MPKAEAAGHLSSHGSSSLSCLDVLQLSQASAWGLVAADCLNAVLAPRAPWGLGPLPWPGSAGLRATG